MEIRTKLQEEIFGSPNLTDSSKVLAFYDVWQTYSKALSEPILKHALLTKEQLLMCFELDNQRKIIPAVHRFGAI